MPTLPALTTQPSPAPVWAGTATPVADIVRPTDPEISQGWPLTAIPPSRQRFNWVLNRLSAGLRYIEQHGIGKWQVEEDYGEDSIVVHDHKLWVAKRANKGKIPPDNADDWDGIASMIAGPGGVDLTTIINQLIAADVTLNTVDVDLQSQIDALGDAIGDIDIPPPLNPRVDYAVEASGTATTSISGYTVTWTVFSSPNSNIKKFYGSVCVLPSAAVADNEGVEYVEFAIPATTIISCSTSIGSFISPSVPTASMGFDAFVANDNLGVMFKHVMGTLLGCHGHRMCIEFI